MKAVDTNVVLRLILNDDPAQAELSRRVISEPCLIDVGVLMEAGWVMRSNYDLPRNAIAAALQTIVDIETIHVSDAARVRWAIERYRDHGADLPDMLHIVAAKGASSFVSFEKHLAKQAGADTPIPIERPA